MDWIQTSQQLRQGILAYARQFSDVDVDTLSSEASISHFHDTLKGATLDGLLQYLTSTLGRNISLNDVADSYCNLNANQLAEIQKGEYSLPRLAAGDDMESKQLKRLETILGKPVFGMSMQEIEDNALFLFTRSRKEYESIAANKKIKLDQMWNGPFEHFIDSTFLFGILEKAFGKTYTPEEVIDKIGKLDLEFRMLHEPLALETKQRYGLAVTFGGTVKGLRTLWDEFQRIREEYEELLPKFEQTHAKLTASHNIPPPKFLADRTISLDMLPLALAYTPDNNLVVMVKKEDGAIYLQEYDTNNGRLISSAKTQFTCPDLNPFYRFGGSLTAGNGMVCAGGNGRVQLFDDDLRSLETIISISGGRLQSESTQQESKSMVLFNDRAMQPKKELQEFNSIYMIVIGDKVLYLSLADRLCDEGSKSAVAIVNQESGALSRAYSSVAFDIYQEGLIGTRRDRFSDAYPRIQVWNGTLYMKADNNILAIDLSGSSKAKQPFAVIDPAELEHDSIPSNHCLDSYGRLWVLTRTPQEEFPSLKAYDGKTNQGNFLTHIYLSNFYVGGFYGAMAISSEGILAHSNTLDRKIRLYELPAPTMQLSGNTGLLSIAPTAS